MRGGCHKSQENRIIAVNHPLNSYRKHAKELLMSEEGHRHRSRRPIEPEAVFGQMKQNKRYKRFRHFGKDKVLMDLTIFAIAFNIGKLFSKLFSGLFFLKNNPNNVIFNPVSTHNGIIKTLSVDLYAKYQFMDHLAA